ncbi:MAG: CBS domain-containing protein [Nanoarchaeota archaeon]
MVIRDLKVTDVMTRNPVTISSDISVIDCAKIMIKKRVGSLVLVHEKKIRGLLTEKDIVWALTKKSPSDFKKIKAGDIAAKKVKVVKPNLELSKALKIMKRSGFRRLPVVFKGQLVGMVTIKDILRIEPTLYSTISDVMEIKGYEEKLKRRESLTDKPESTRQGICEECGNFDWLSKVDNRVMCESCVDEM